MAGVLGSDALWDLIEPWRWVVERTFAWLNQFRQLRLRYEKRPDMHLAFLTFACIRIC
jgi:transposase